MPSLSFDIINFTCDVGSVDMEPWLRFSSLTHVSQSSTLCPIGGIYG